MNILDLAKRDIEDITSNSSDGWAVEVKLTSPDDKVANVEGIHKKISLGVDPETLQAINSTTAAVSVSERFLKEQDYPVRDEDGEVHLKGHIVEVKDSTGVVKEYVAEEWIPDETVGLIVIILGKLSEGE